MRPKNTKTWLFVALLGLAVGGCTVPVAQGLDEGDANEVSVALEHAGIDSSKELDPGGEGRFRVVVARDDANGALGVLRDESLPRPKPKGVLDALGGGSLVPSRAAEHAQFLAGLSGDLESTLRGIDGVLMARVHLHVPEPDPLRATPTDHATASVLLEHRGATPPMTTEAVQRLISGGVSGLAVDQVAVVQLARPARAQNQEQRLHHIGPLAVSKGSLRPLQLAFAGLIVLIMVQTALILGLFSRVSRLRRGAS